MTLAMVVALAAALCFASGNAIQHRAAGRVATDGGMVRMLGRLARSPQWLAGSVIAFSAFLLHVTAMNLGVAAVVQPFMLAAVLLAVPVRAFLDKQKPDRSEVWWVAFTVAGIIGFVSSANTHRSTGDPHDLRALMLAVAGFTLASLWAAAAPRAQRGEIRAFFLATASGVVFGVTAGLMKFVRHDWGLGTLGFFGTWHIWALFVGSVLGTTLNQRSYQAAKLAASLPAMNVTNIVTAVGFSWAVFNEPPSLTPTAFALQVFFLLCATLGIWQVARKEEEAEEQLHELEERSEQLDPTS